MNILAAIFLSFLKIGAFAFGGGYAMLPLIEREIVITHRWISYKEFIDIIGISQMTPGPIAINSSTFVGYKVGGVLGSIAGTIGVITVSFVLVSIATHYVIKFKESKPLKATLMGMKPALIGLIICAFISLAGQSYHDVRSAIMGIVVMGVLLSKKIHPILVILLSGAIGILIFK